MELKSTWACINEFKCHLAIIGFIGLQYLEIWVKEHIDKVCFHTVTIKNLEQIDRNTSSNLRLTSKKLLIR